MDKFGRLLKVQWKFQITFSKHFSSRPTFKPPTFPSVFSPPNSKPFTIDLLRPKYRDALIEYIDEYFIPLDPNGVALGYKELREKRDPLFLSHSRKYTEAYVDNSIHSNPPVSTLAFDHEGKLAGLCFGEARHLPLGIKKLDVERSSEWDLAYTSPFFKDMTKMVNLMNDGVDFSSFLSPRRLEIVRKRNPQQIILADMPWIGTRSDIRKLGLAAVLFQKCFELMLSMDVVDLIMATSVNPYTTRQSVDHGFKIIREMKWPFGGLVPGRSVT